MRIKIVLTLALFALSILTTGCARITSETTAPLYDLRTDLKFDPRLLGVWLPDTECVKLCRGDGNTYLAGSGGMSWLVVFGDTFNTGAEPESIHLVKIGKYEYFFAAPKPGETGTTFTCCCKVEFANDRITLHGLNLQAVADDLQKHPDALKIEWTEKPSGLRAVMRPTTQTVDPATQPTMSPPAEKGLRDGDLKITDDPTAIRAYLVKHQDDGDFFSDPVVLYRIAK